MEAIMNTKKHEKLVMQFIPADPTKWTSFDIDLVTAAVYVDVLDFEESQGIELRPRQLAEAVQHLYDTANKGLGNRWYDFQQKLCA